MTAAAPARPSSVAGPPVARASVVRRPSTLDRFPPFWIFAANYRPLGSHEAPGIQSRVLLFGDAARRRTRPAKVATHAASAA